jgi:iron complex outermembrane recepter protein
MRSQGIRDVFYASFLGAASTIAILGTASSAYAQSEHDAKVTVPSMPLEDAIKEVGHQTGAKVLYDPDGVKGKTSEAVNGVKGVKAALQRAISGSGLAVEFRDGAWQVGNDIIVVARRDEAETSTLVRSASTSDRNGTSLREQPRNTQVISSKVIADQQSLSVNEILANAGAVAVSGVNGGGGSQFSVRGYSAAGLVNGLSNAGTFGGPSGSALPVANIERVEILKGPDAVLSGFNNSGGNVNIVTKKPFADRLLTGEVDTGSYGLVRLVGDLNGALTSNKKLSARVVGSWQTQDHNSGGYTGNKDWMVAPTIRFKDEHTDVVLGAQFEQSVTPPTPYTAFSQLTAAPFAVDPSKPLYSADQAIRVKDTRFFIDASHDFSGGFGITVRGLHDRLKLNIDTYNINPRFSLANANNALVGNGTAMQENGSDAFDAFARFKGHFGNAVKWKANFGFNFLAGFNTPYSYDSATDLTIPFLDLQDPSITPLPLVPSTIRSFDYYQKQQGIFGQVQFEFWKLKVLFGGRENWYFSHLVIPGFEQRQSSSSFSPNAGAILDVTGNFSIFANYQQGQRPVTTTAFDGTMLPNVRSENKEVGVKIDLFQKRTTITASYFDLEDTNTIIDDRDHPGFSTEGPGQRGRGFDFNITGTILSGWTLLGQLTKTSYARLDTTNTVDDGPPIVAGVPDWTYSIYSNYSRKLGDDLTGGVSAGLYGRSSSTTEYYTGGARAGYYSVPAARQVNANVFLTYKGYQVNVGVRNLFNRLNYGVTPTRSYLPFDEPINFRVSIAKRLF